MRRSPFVAVEVLGPRDGLDGWLEALQDLGTLHVADALAGLEGEPGITRPAPSVAEREGATLRSEAARVLRAVERVLPPSGRGTGDRPSFVVGYGGEGRSDLETAVREARAVAGRLLAALEAGREADHALEATEAQRLLLLALAPGASALPRFAFALPGEAHLARLVRRFEALGAAVRVQRGVRQVVLAVEGPAADGAALLATAADAAARPLALPSDLLAGGRDAALQRAAGDWDRARQRDEQALEVLRRTIDADSPRARRLLDAVEDAEARLALASRLAATEHVVALRAWVPREDRAALGRRLAARCGPAIVVRDLAPGPDAPGLGRTVAPTPLAARAGLAPARFGDVPAPALLALAVPLAVGLAWADLAGGLLLLLGGGFLSLGATPLSPRRDTAVLAQLAGLLALAGGLLVGQAFGTLGERWFGTGWGLLGPVEGLPDAPQRLALLLTATALALALLGLGAAYANQRAGRPARAGAALSTALTLFVVSGGGALALPGSVGAYGLVALALAAAALLVLLRGLAEGASALALDLAAVFRLAAVALAALLASRLAFAALAHAGGAALVPALAVLLVAALAVVVDPAHVAMGVPYDLSLGARALAPPYEPFVGRGPRQEDR